MFTDSITVIVGIGISKDYADFFVLNRKENPSGRRPRRVVLEATGGFEGAVWVALEAAGLTMAVVHPNVRVRLRSLDGIAGQDRST